jgi:hypothetical protein
MAQSNISVKSNVMLKIRGEVPPIDNMPGMYFDVRLRTALNKEQSMQLEKMHFWAKKIYDEENNLILDECYKGCENCGNKNNHCKLTKNIIDMNK